MLTDLRAEFVKNPLNGQMAYFNCYFPQAFELYSTNKLHEESGKIVALERTRKGLELYVRWGGRHVQRMHFVEKNTIATLLEDFDAGTVGDLQDRPVRVLAEGEGVLGRMGAFMKFDPEDTQEIPAYRSIERAR